MTTATNLYGIAHTLKEAREVLLRSIEIDPAQSVHLEVAQRYLHTARLATQLAAERCEQHHVCPAPPENPLPRRWMAHLLPDRSEKRM